MSDNNTGVYLNARSAVGKPTGILSNVSMTNNFIMNNGNGILISNNAAATNHANNNSITGNSLFGISNNDPDDTFNASCNWFGTDVYSTILTKVNGLVNFMPYLVTGDEEPGEETTPGFQPEEPNPCTNGAVAITSSSATPQTCDYMGTITVEFSGGTSPYTISWTGASNGGPVSATSPHTISNLPGGNYSVTVYAVGSQASTNVTVDYLPVKNTTGPVYFATIQAAVDAASNGQTIELCAGNYTETVNVNKDLTIIGPNVGRDPNVLSRYPEAIIYDGKINMLGSNTITIDGVKVYQTNAITPVSLGGSTVATIQNTIIERFGSTTGSTVRGIEISNGTGIKNIKNNLFTGDASGGVYGGHKTWNSGIFMNGPLSTININDNVFENCRTALNIDDMGAGINLAGNIFQNSGTFISFGGTTPTTGSFIFGSNNFKSPIGALVNLSNVATSFRLDITSSMYDGTVFSSLPLTTLFTNIESTIYHRGRSGRNGLVTYVT
jgi:hypothetical protein